MDQLIAPQNTIDYYQSVLADMGSKQDDFLKLFMVPGMLHCGGGPGPTLFDPVAALDHWVESGTAPQQMEAKRTENGQAVMTRPLCAYPKIAKYSGKGSPAEAANFTCE